MKNYAYTVLFNDLKVTVSQQMIVVQIVLGEFINDRTITVVPGRLGSSTPIDQGTVTRSRIGVGHQGLDGYGYFPPAFEISKALSTEKLEAEEEAVVWRQGMVIFKLPS